MVIFFCLGGAEYFRAQVMVARKSLTEIWKSCLMRQRNKSMIIFSQATFTLPPPPSPKSTTHHTRAHIQKREHILNTYPGVIREK